MKTGHHRRGFPALFAGLALALVVGAPAVSSAQEYFGHNKVQYRTFDFQVMRTEHFDVYFYPEEEVAARDAARMAERWYARLSRMLDHEFKERQPLILYANHPHFQQTTALSGEISDGTGGVTEAFKQRVILPFAHSYEETDHVLGHELVHAFQYDISGLGRAGAGIEQAAQRFQVPGWFIEGMAEYLSVGPRDALTANWLRNAALSGEIPTIDQLSRDPNIFPYRYGHAVWAYIGGRWGDPAIGQILALAGQGMPYEEAFLQILNISVDELTEDWHAAVRRAYLPLLGERWEARQVARGLVTEEKGGGEMNLSPSISPDGKWVAFLSELDFLDVELHLANVETGEVVRTLQKGTTFDQHFSSLRFINSAGTWSPDSKQFAIGAQAGGEDVIVLLDVERARRVRQYDLGGLGEVSTPTWSPDGRTIVFSALQGGWSDLYSLDVAAGTTTRLTEDRYADLHPAYSPDGRTIAFVTDRFGTDVSSLVYGAYELARMDLGSRRIERVTETGASHNINPQWAGDGTSLFFISNCTGIPNVYRVEVGSGRLHQVTDLFSGVSGITDTSPALTVSRDGGSMVFTAFEDNGYNLYALNDRAALQGRIVERVDCGPTAAAASLLPPSPRPTEAAFNRVANAIADDTIGLPPIAAATSYVVDKYRPRLGLDYLGQPQVGVSAGGLFGGVGLYGGITGIFSDILGRHTVGGALQMQGQLDEVGGVLQYMNTKTRLNYGFTVQRIPYVYGYYGAGGGGFGNQVEQELVRVRYFDSALQGFASYPISAAQRFELGGGLRRLSQDQQVYNLLIDRRTGMVIDRQREDVAGVGYNMVEGSAAWVYDSSVSGYTGPLAGQRARVEVSPVLGQLQFVTGLADFRHYSFFKPITVAVRAMHYGRYGRDAEGIFSDLFLGYPYLVRGYESAYNSCYNFGTSCETINSLIGSRIAVANLEVRLPLLSPMRNALMRFGLPVDAIAFADAGVAWGNGTHPTFQFGMPTDTSARGILSSVGVGARVNLFGALLLEIDRVKALDANNGWTWVFAMQPGF